MKKFIQTVRTHNKYWNILKVTVYEQIMIASITYKLGKCFTNI